MVNNSKVLTVSYGTFSCTLEGFDESFDTMKSIAEYFRDLASDDRYFGAEPPTPDAEMLARIAQRETERRVAARADQGKIVLTAADPAPQQTAAQQATSAPIEATAQPVPARPAQPSELLSENTPDIVEPEQGADNVFADETTAPDDANDAAAVDMTAEVDAAPASTTESAPQIHVEQPEAEPVTAEPVAAERDDKIAAVAARLKAATAPKSPVRTDDDNSIAAKLQRIRDVVSKSETDDAEDLYSEDEHAESFLAETARDIEQAMDIEDASQAQMSDEAQADLDATTEVEEALAKRFADQAAAKDKTKTPASQPPPPQPTQAQAEPTPEPAVTADAEPPQKADSATEDGALSRTERLRARVIRMKRSEQAPVVPEQASEDVPARAPEPQAAPEAQPVQDATPDIPPEPEIETSLSDEDEAELMAELAEVEAELSGDTATTARSEPTEVAETAEQPEPLSEPVPEPATEAVSPEPELQPEPVEATAQEPVQEERVSLRRRQLPKDDDSEMDRLLQQTNTHLDEPEGTRRRSAIAHLRAAVAATKAEKSVTNTAQTDASDDPYNDDLAHAVKPRRSPPKEGRRKSKRSAPLKLVASQRVDLEKSRKQDTDQPRDRSPVRPRRVTTKNAEAGKPKSRTAAFQDFAEAAGVNTMGELVEAAAAFLYFDQGWAGFSRTQILRLCRESHDDIFNREDGLRSFGQLLRDGKIEKSEDGRFTASERVSYRDSRQQEAG